MKLRQMNPNLKILISIGGWFAKSTPFNRILTNEITRNTFIQNTLNFLRNWKFDGLGKSRFVLSDLFFYAKNCYFIFKKLFKMSIFIKYILIKKTNFLLQ